MRHFCLCMILMFVSSCSSASYEIGKPLPNMYEKLLYFSYIRGIESENSYDCTNKKRVIAISGTNGSLWCLSVNAVSQAPHNVTSISLYQEPSKSSTKAERAKIEKTSHIKSIILSPCSIRIKSIEGHEKHGTLSGLPFVPLGGSIAIE